MKKLVFALLASAIAINVMADVLGAAVSHNFKLASSADGSTPNGHIAVWAALAILLIVSVVCTFAGKKEGKKCLLV